MNTCKHAAAVFIRFPHLCYCFSDKHFYENYMHILTWIFDYKHTWTMYTHKLTMLNVRG